MDGLRTKSAQIGLAIGEIFGGAVLGVGGASGAIVSAGVSATGVGALVGGSRSAARVLVPLGWGSTLLTRWRSEEPAARAWKFPA